MFADSDNNYNVTVMANASSLFRGRCDLFITNKEHVEIKKTFTFLGSSQDGVHSVYSMAFHAIV